ncbi:MAG: hypothetical protein HYT06_01120 [Candidatus Levybacteria bacterium]|nr:hypothetical protein [Candidatus Levybacteria bacterium]
MHISANKLTGYLLSETHSVGRFKAKFFRSIGFSKTNSSSLKKEIIRIAQSNKVKEVVSTKHGKKYIIDGQLHTPTGKRVEIRTVWIIEAEQIQPSFVTAYPL